MSSSYQLGSTATFIFTVLSGETIENPSVAFMQGDTTLVLSEDWCEIDNENHTVSVKFTEEEAMSFEEGDIRVQLSLNDSVRSTIHTIPAYRTVLGALYEDEEEEEGEEESPEEIDMSDIVEEDVPEDYDPESEAEVVIEDGSEPEPEVDPEWYDPNLPATNDSIDLDGEYVEPEFVDDSAEKAIHNDDSDPIFEEEESGE